MVRENRRAPWLAVAVVCVGAFMGQLDASIVTITFPSMEHAFQSPSPPCNGSPSYTCSV